MRSIWRVEPWTGALSLDLPTAWTILNELVDAADPDASARLLADYERGAVVGWAEVCKRKRKD